eukprot:gene9975-18593_t
MPIKSHTTEKVPRRELKRINLESTSKKCFVYDSFKSLLARVKGLKLEGWNLECKEDRVILQKQEPDCFIPKFELCVDDSLGYYIQVYGWLLPEDHPLYTVNHRSMRHITLSNLVADIDGYRICTGLSIKIASQHTVNHVVPRKFDPLSIEQDIQYRSSEYCRSINCLLVCPTEKCEHCIEGDDYGIKVTRDNKRRLSIPSKLNAPVSKTHPERLKQSMQEQRLKCSKLESEIERMSQRYLGRRCDNPDLVAFGYNDNTIRIQRHIGLGTGNTRGSNSGKAGKKWVNVVENSLPKRQGQRRNDRDNE